MSSKSSNIDPALGGADQARQHQPERSNSNTFASPANTSFRQDGLQTASSLSDHQLGQHYYHYPSLAQPNLAQRSAQSSIQQSPAAHAYRGSVSSATEASPAAAEPAHDDAAQDESKRQRACEACRGLKVRCDQDPANPDASCKRCAKAGRQCVITQPSRKRQKKADSRVAELERKLDALTAALEGRQAVPAAPPAIELQPRRRSIALEHPPVHIDGPPVRHIKKCDSIYEATPNAKRKRIDDAIVEDERSSSTLISVTSQTTGEIFTNYNDISAANWRNKINALMPFETSSELFRRYNEVMTPYCPMVVFPHGTHAEQILAEKPILYLAIITAASGGVLQADLPIKLQRESLGAIADSVVRNGEKSLELIQAMLVLSIWYKPPDRAEQTNFYQILHMAAIMSLDIGLGRRSGRGKTRTPFGKVEIPFSSKQPAFNPDALDARRAWLGCYYLCATASMVLRRPNLVRWTEYMKECIEVLENSPDSQPSDRLLCQHIKIQHICEDIGLQFLMDDSTANVNINDPKVTYALVTLENQLKAWKQQVPVDVQCASLTFFEHVTSLYLHEIALHFNHNIEDFRLPFSVESVKNIDSSTDALTQAQITATEACLKAAHGILDTIIGFTNEEILALPLLLFFVRVVYALVILIKMHMSIKTPDSELGKLMKNTDLRIEYFMDSLIKKFTEIRALGLAKPDKALAIMRVLREWYVKHKDGPKPADETAASTASEQKQEKPEQTPLHMLSQVASGQQGDAPQQNGTAADEHTDWTFPAPSMVNYRRPPVGNPLNYRNPYPRQDNGAQQDGPYGQVAGFDTTNNFQSYGWVPGVEQAMDMTLAHMGDLQAGGLDSWFLGDSAAPFMYGDTIGGNASDETMGQW